MSYAAKIILYTKFLEYRIFCQIHITKTETKKLTKIRKSLAPPRDQPNNVRRQRPKLGESVENGLKYPARSALDFLERDRPSFVLGDRNKTVFVGRNMPDHLVLLIKNGWYLAINMESSNN